MLLRLTTKLAEVVNGLDLSHCAEGDVIEVPDRDAAMLIMEGWAQAAAEMDVATCEPKVVERAVAADVGFGGWRKADRDDPRAKRRFHVMGLKGPS